MKLKKHLDPETRPLTSIRAGIIIGPNGSSFRIVQKLVKNLPVMACPEWTKSLNQPIDILDALKIIKSCIGNEKTFNKPLEIGGNQVITYMDLLKITAKKMTMGIFNIFIDLYNYWIVKVMGKSNYRYQ